MAFTRKMSLQIKERDSHCWHCGETDDLQMHHRRNRGMGGSKSLDRFDNLIRVCAWLNYAMESDAAVASEARDKGWKLGQWDGFDTPVYDQALGRWFLLDQFGNKFPSAPPSYLI